MGFDLPEFDCKAIKVDNKPYDIVGQKELAVKSGFVEQLTHQCFVLLAIHKPRAEKKNTRLEKFLDLFIQKLLNEPSNTIIDIEIDTEEDEELKNLVDYLNQATLDEELVRRIDAEKQHYKGIESLEKQVTEERKQKEEERKQKEEERRQKEEERRQKEDAEAREEEERRQKEDAEAREEEANQKILLAIKTMVSNKIPISVIAQSFNMSEDEINKLLNDSK